MSSESSSPFLSLLCPPSHPEGGRHFLIESTDIREGDDLVQVTKAQREEEEGQFVWVGPFYGEKVSLAEESLRIRGAVLAEIPTSPMPREEPWLLFSLPPKAEISSEEMDEIAAREAVKAQEYIEENIRRFYSYKPSTPPMSSSSGESEEGDLQDRDAENWSENCGHHQRNEGRGGKDGSVVISGSDLDLDELTTEDYKRLIATPSLTSSSEASSKGDLNKMHPTAEDLDPGYHSGRSYSI